LFILQDAREQDDNTNHDKNKASTSEFGTSEIRVEYGVEYLAACGEQRYQKYRDNYYQENHNH